MKKQNIGLVVETVLLFLLLYFLIMSLIIKELYQVVEYITSFLLLNLGYNNFYINKKNKIGIIFLVCGIIMLVTTMVSYGR